MPSRCWVSFTDPSSLTCRGVGDAVWGLPETGRTRLGVGFYMGTVSRILQKYPAAKIKILRSVGKISTFVSQTTHTTYVGVYRVPLEPPPTPVSHVTEGSHVTEDSGPGLYGGRSRGRVAVRTLPVPMWFSADVPPLYGEPFARTDRSRRGRGEYTDVGVTTCSLGLSSRTGRDG